MHLLEAYILDEGLGHHILLDGLAGLLTAGLAYHHTLGLRTEQDAAGGDGGSGAVAEAVHSDAGEAHLEDAHASQAYLLAQFEEVLDGLAQL